MGEEWMELREFLKNDPKGSQTVNDMYFRYVCDCIEREMDSIESRFNGKSLLEAGY